MSIIEKLNRIYINSLRDWGVTPINFFVTKKEFEELRNELNSMRRYTDDGGYNGLSGNNIMYHGIIVEMISDKKKKSKLPEWF